MLAAIPRWVPFVLLALMFLGWRQSLTRTVKPTALVAIALAMFGFSLVGVVGSFGGSMPSLTMWFAGYASVLLAGTRLVAQRGMVADGDAVRIPGSWVPMLLIMGIFAAKFALGFAVGVRSPWLHSAWFVLSMSTVLGALSGGFGARAWAVSRYARSVAPTSSPGRAMA